MVKRIILVLAALFALACGGASVEQTGEIEQPLTLQAQESCTGDYSVGSPAFTVGSVDGTFCNTQKDFGTFAATQLPMQVSNNYIQMATGQFQCEIFKWPGMKGQLFCNTFSIGRVRLQIYIGNSNQPNHLYSYFCDALGTCEFRDSLTFAPNGDFSTLTNLAYDTRSTGLPWTPAQLGCGVAADPAFGICMQPLDVAFIDAARLEIYKN